MRILIAEDNPDIADLLSAIILAQFEAQVVVAINGQQAIDYISSEAPFDLVLSDYRMPFKNGGEVYLHLRAHYPRTPFILISSDSATEHEEFKDARFVGSVIKPFEEELLLGQIQLMTSQTELRDFSCGFVPVSLEIFHKIEYCKQNIYVELSKDHYVKVLNQQARFGDEELARFKKKQVPVLYIESNHFSELIALFRANVFAKVDWATIDSDKALENLSNDWELISKASLRFGWPPNVVNLAKKNIAVAIQVLAKKPDFQKMMKLYQEKQQGRLVDHAFLLVVMCTAIVNELGWKAELNLQKLTFAALLHDVDLDEELFATKQTLINDEAIEEIKTQPELLKIFEHPKLSAERLSRWPSCPSDVDRLILEHHERPDGQGFPRGINFQHIFPLSAVMILAEDVIYHCADNFGIKPYDYLLAKKGSYDHGEFKNIYAATLRCLSR